MSASHYRILDANLNRLREGLRVIEEHARFVLNEPSTAERVKLLRHLVRQIVNAVGPESLLAARDTPHDVGRDITPASELQRDSEADIVAAAFGRCQEAARAIEEYAKLIASEAVQPAAALRYELYILEPTIRTAGQLRRRLRAAKLYVLITEALCRGDWLATAEAALQGGARCMQLREKTLDAGELLARARALRELTQRYNALLVINDRPDIAKLCSADAVHVGQEDLSIADVRRVAGNDVLVGKSTRSREHLQAALAEWPDYIAVGPMFDSETKPQSRIAGLSYLRAAREQTDLPIVAIGGITAQNAVDVFAAGADVVAVCAGVIGASDPEVAARAILGAG